MTVACAGVVGRVLGAVMVQLLLLLVAPAGICNAVVPQVLVKPGGKVGVSVELSALPGAIFDVIVQVDTAPGVVRLAGVHVTDSCGSAGAAGTLTLAEGTCVV